MQPHFPNADKGEGGIRRVVEALRKYLPTYGIDLTDDIESADLTVGHGAISVVYPDKPFVSHNHGLYWSEYEWGDWAHITNLKVIEALTQADAITAPSEWVREALTRGIMRNVRVIPHGIDADEWEYTGEHSDYVLWNKARADSVSEPKDMQTLAALMPDVKFVSTLGEKTANVHICNVGSIEQMKPVIQKAGLYLATARETFGIGTLEAMASGVPVVGWDYGGQREIIQQGETGYLAPYGDYAALADCVRRALSERERLSQHCVATVHERYQWVDQVRLYADLYQDVVEEYTHPRPKVSVIIPSHNYAHYLPDAIRSVQAQTLQDYECLIVDDASTDDTARVAAEIVTQDARFHYLQTPQNLKLSATRNYGFDHAQGKYILYLDADDQLGSEMALSILANALDEDRSIHIAYGLLDLMNETGTDRRSNPFPKDFNWFKQMAHLNQVPTAAMMRREVIEASGGWRTRQWRAEDAEFWSRVTSYGFYAKKVTEVSTLLYRLHQQSKGAIEHRENADHDGNWLALIPWRSANAADEGNFYLKKYGESVPMPSRVPFAAQGKPKEDLEFSWSVSHFQDVLVTIVVVVGENGSLIDTLDSLVGQDVNSWRVIVIGNPVAGASYPYYSSALPDALREIHSPYTLFLTSEDFLPTDTLRRLLLGERHTKYELIDNGFKDAKARVKAWFDKHFVAPVNPNHILMKFLGTNRGEITLRVNRNSYRVHGGEILWMLKQDAEKVLPNGMWAKVPQELAAPAPTVVDRL